MMKARDNPFSTDRIHRIRYRLSPPEWSALEQKLHAMARRGAIVGPEGAGKTTLLEDISVRLNNAGWTTRWLRLTREQPAFRRGFLRQFFASLGPRDVILFDGAEQLGRFSWKKIERASRRGAGLLITSHRAGLLPTLHECRTSPELLLEIIRDLLPSNSTHDQRRLSDLAHALHGSHGGNLREALREMYDKYADDEPLDEQNWRGYSALRQASTITCAASERPSLPSETSKYR